MVEEGNRSPQAARMLFLLLIMTHLIALSFDSSPKSSNVAMRRHAGLVAGSITFRAPPGGVSRETMTSEGRSARTGLVSPRGGPKPEAAGHLLAALMPSLCGLENAGVLVHAAIGGRPRSSWFRAIPYVRSAR